MKKFALCVGVLFAVVANAALTPRAVSVGHHATPSVSRSAATLCEDTGARAEFAVPATSTPCATRIGMR